MYESLKGTYFETVEITTRQRTQRGPAPLHSMLKQKFSGQLVHLILYRLMKLRNSRDVRVGEYSRGFQDEELPKCLYGQGIHNTELPWSKEYMGPSQESE